MAASRVDASSASVVVVLAQHAPVVDAVREDVGLDLVGGGAPGRPELGVAADLGQLGGAVERDPAHELRRHVVLRLAAGLPDALVGLAPHRGGALGLGLDDRPQPRGSRWLRRVCSRIESSTAPNTSFWRWSKAPLPMRTGRAPA